MQGLVKLLLNILYGVQIGRDIDEFYKCKSEHWMQTEYDEILLDYWRLPNGSYIVKIKKDDGLDGDTDVQNTLSSHLGAFFNVILKELSIISSKKSMDFIITVYTTETPIVCIKKINIGMY